MTPNLRFHPVLAAVLGAFSTAPALAADVILDPVSVTGSRAEQRSFDLPAAIDVVGRERLDADQPRVNASEVLASVPGLTALNRQNYAQDLQLSSRGFGRRGPRRRSFSDRRTRRHGGTAANLRRRREHCSIAR